MKSGANTSAIEAAYAQLRDEHAKMINEFERRIAALEGKLSTLIAVNIATMRDPIRYLDSWALLRGEIVGIRPPTKAQLFVTRAGDRAAADVAIGKFNHPAPHLRE